MINTNYKIAAALISLVATTSIMADVEYAGVNITVNRDAKVIAKPISGCEIDTVIEFDVVAGEGKIVQLPIRGETALGSFETNAGSSTTEIYLQNSNVVISAKDFQEGSYSLYSVNGREVMKGDITPLGEATLSLSSLAQGLYFLKVYKGNRMFSTKIVNQNTPSAISQVSVGVEARSSRSSMMQATSADEITYNFDIVTKDAEYFSKNTQVHGVTKSSITDLAFNLERRDPSLRDLAAQNGIKFGTAFGYRENVDHDEYENEFLNHFGSLTAEWGLPFSECRRSAEASGNDVSTWNLEHAERVATFAQDSDIPMTGHHLIWHYWNYKIDTTTGYWLLDSDGKKIKDIENDHLLPQWVLDSTYTSKEDVFTLMKDHITTLMTHFKVNYPGVIREWSVVNELASNNEYGFCPSFWYEHLGELFVDSAFIWANQADPDAKLIYNEYFYGGAGYGGVYMEDKVDFTYNRIHGLLERGVPVHAVGLQSHVSDKTFDKELFEANVRRFTDGLGIEVLITELDVQLAVAQNPDGTANDTPDANPETYQKQAEVYKSVMEVVLDNPKCNTLTLWGFNDAQTYSVSILEKKYDPTICDSLYVPKPAWYGLRDALLQNLSR